jgi:hypothetical protein
MRAVGRASGRYCASPVTNALRITAPHRADWTCACGASLADFGLNPKKARTPLTIEEKAAAAAKRKATRAARHTMGSKQKVVTQSCGP